MVPVAAGGARGAAAVWGAMVVCRSADAAMWALSKSGVKFRVIVNKDGTVERWQQPRLEPWEVPRRDPSEPLTAASEGGRTAARRAATMAGAPAGESGRAAGGGARQRRVGYRTRASNKPEHDTHLA